MARDRQHYADHDEFFNRASPGELLEHVMSILGVTQGQFATFVGVSRHSINELVRGRRNLTPEMAVRISQELRDARLPERYYFATLGDPRLLLHLQENVDLARIQTTTTRQPSAESARG